MKKQALKPENNSGKILGTTAAVGAYIIAFIVSGVIISGLINNKSEAPNNEKAISSEAYLTTAKNSFISSCKQTSKDSGYTDVQLERYCTCGEKTLSEKYGPKLYESEMTTNITRNGYSQEDTDLVISNCSNQLTQ